MKSVKVALFAGLIGFVGVAEAEELTAYYKSGYIGDHSSAAADALKLTAASGGEALEYTNEHGEWTLIIDSNSPSSAQAWCADKVKYNDLPINIVKVVIKRDFTFKPGVDAALFSGVELEVEQDRKLTLTNDPKRNLSIGSVTFSGAGTVDALVGVTFTTDITIKGNVVVNKQDFVAYANGENYDTLAKAVEAAKPSGTITMLVDVMTLATSAIPTGLKNSSEWTGTMELGSVNTANFAYDLQNLGNPSSKICLNGYKNYPCAPTNVSNVGRDVVAGAWVIGENGAEFWGGFSNFGFNYVGNLEGTGLLKITNTGDNNWGQNYVRFKGNPSEFAGSIDMTGSGYRLILAPADAGAAESWAAIATERPMIHVSGVAAQVAEGKTWTAKTIKIDGTISGSGTLGATDKVIFGNDAVIDLKDGALTASGAVTFGSSLKLIGVNYDDVVLSCAQKPTNLDSVQLKDAEGHTPAFWKLSHENGNVYLREREAVAEVNGVRYVTLQEAFDAAKPSGTIKVIAANWPTTNFPEGFKYSEQWQGTVQFTGTMPRGFVPSNYGNAKSTIEFKGVSDGCITNTSLDFPGAIKLTNKGESAAWTVSDGYSGDSWPLLFGALTGDGDLVDIGGAKQPFVFQDASKFRGSITSVLKRFIVGDKIYSGGDGRIYVQSGYDLAVASKKSLKAANGIYVDGTIKGSGTLASATIFGNTAVIDCSEGSLTASGAVTFGSTLTIKNAEEGGVVIKCSLEPVNLRDVMLKGENGSLMPLAHLEYDQGTGEVRYFAKTKKISGMGTWEVTNPMLDAFSEEFVLDLSEYYGEGGGKPIGESSHILIKFPSGTTTDASQAVIDKIQVVYPTLHSIGSLTAEGDKIFFTFGHLDLYWSKWRGTFWEAVFGGDVHGNNGFGRTESGAEQAILAGDTIIFDKRHYQVGDVFAEQSPYWHYDENLYIKDEVNPGVNNDWDLKVLEGVTLKMGLRGAKTTGQNIIRDFKIYVDANSTLELGYWGNTHHYQGVIRPNVTFGGLGTITLGDDMGASCRVEGDLKVKQDPSAQETEVPTLNVRGKELVVKGGTIDVNLTGFGALSGSGTITTPIIFSNATINATDANGFTFKNKTTFTGTLTVDMTAAPTGEDLIKICTKGVGGSFVFKEGIDVLVRVGGSVQPAFYTLATDTDGNLCVKVAPVPITYEAEVVLGYDYKTMICRVTMTPAIEGVAAEVTVSDVAAKLTTWTAPVVGMRGSGRAEVMVGDADNNFEPGTYSMTVSVGVWRKELRFELATQNDGNLAEVNGNGYKTMQEAVAVAGESGTIKLLTNVFLAAPEGTYAIDRNGFDVKTTNYTTIDALTNKVTAEDEVVFTRDGEGVTRVVIAGDWLAAGLPWRTKKTIDADVWSAGETMAPFEAYVLGIPAAKMGTYKPIVRGVQTDDPNTIELTDDLPIKDASETGVVVTRNLVDAETKEKVSDTAVYDLSQMNGKSKLLKLGYSFAHDAGQD